MIRRVTDRLLGSRLGSRLFGTVVHFDHPDGVALTFDDGPDPEFTPRILDVLKRHAAKATFFVIGEAAVRYPEIIRRIADEGHAVCNHSWSHRSFPFLRPTERRLELARCQRAIEPFGHRILRFPYGHETLGTRLTICGSRYTVVNWSGHGQDWVVHTPSEIVDRLLQNLTPGAILLLHDGLHDAADPEAFDRSAVVDAVDLFLETIGRRYRLMTLPELLETGTERRRTNFLPDDAEVLKELRRQMKALIRSNGDAS